MRGKYSYLKQYVDQGKAKYELYENTFWSLDDTNEIKEAEKRLGFNFPPALKEFWIEIGIGNLTTPHDAKEGYECSCKNEFLSPTSIADIILLKEESGLILPEAPMVEGAIPFFEIADLFDFLVMIPESDNPEAVYDQYGYYVDKNLETFVYRLYNESPTYYLEEMKKVDTTKSQ